MSDRAEVVRIADQLRRAVEGTSWCGPNLRALLADVTAEQALARPVPAGHSIAELVAHVAVWMEVPVRRYLAGEAYDPPPDEDWPAVAGADGWRSALARLDAAYHALLDALEELADADLARPVAGKAYNVYVVLHGVVQHTLWHGGQIALLTRAV